MDKNYIIDYLVDEAEYDREELESLSPYELFDKYLQWNGIIGYTRDILDMVQSAYEIDLI